MQAAAEAAAELRSGPQIPTLLPQCPGCPRAQVTRCRGCRFRFAGRLSLQSGPQIRGLPAVAAKPRSPDPEAAARSSSLSAAAESASTPQSEDAVTWFCSARHIMGLRRCCHPVFILEWISPCPYGHEGQVQ